MASDGPEERRKKAFTAIHVAEYQTNSCLALLRRKGSDWICPQSGTGSLVVESNKNRGKDSRDFFRDRDQSEI